jgi:type IV secretory pathway VirB10-like protein
MVGERLTRDEALSLLKRAVAELTTSEDAPVPASAVRRKARELLGRDSETLDERFFLRILRDAHDADVIDLRKRGDDYEVAPAAAAASVADQLAAAVPVAPEPSQSSRSAANAASLRRGMRGRTRGGELPPELLSLGVIGAAAPRENNVTAALSAPALVLDAETEPEASTPAAPATRAKRGRAPAKTARAKKTAAPAAASAEKPAAKTKRPRAKKTAGSTES